MCCGDSVSYNSLTRQSTTAHKAPQMQTKCYATAPHPHTHTALTGWDLVLCRRKTRQPLTHSPHTNDHNVAFTTIQRAPRAHSRQGVCSRHRPPPSCKQLNIHQAFHKAPGDQTAQHACTHISGRMPNPDGYTRMLD